MNKISTWIIGLFVCLGIISSISTHAAESNQASNPPNQGIAKVWIYRDEWPGRGLTPSISFDGKAIGELRSYTHFLVTVPEGKHTVSTEFRGNSSDVSLNFLAGHEYYLWAEVKWFLEGKLEVGFKLKQVDESKAVPGIKNTKIAAEINLHTPSGENVYVGADGSSYKAGSYYESKTNVKITYEASDPREFYEGEVSKGLPNGNGVLYFKPTNKLVKLEGSFVDGGPENVLATYQDGKTYKGAMSGWKFHGPGQIETQNQFWDCEFKSGEPTTCSIKYKNGNSYSGEMKAWKFHGLGDVKRDNETWNCKFNNGAPLSCFVSDDLGSSYEGEIKNWMMHGKGDLRISNKGRLVGTFNENRFTAGEVFDQAGLPVTSYVNGTPAQYAQSDLSWVGDLLVFSVQAIGAYYSNRNHHTQVDISPMAVSLLAGDEDIKPVIFEEEKMGSWRSKPREIVPLISGKDYSLPSLSKKSDSWVGSSKTSRCSSDYDCGIGFTCVKGMYSSSGSCMQSVNNMGTRIYNTPNPSSIGVRNKGDCNFSTDCPTGFDCDSQSKACIRR